VYNTREYATRVTTQDQFTPHTYTRLDIGVLDGAGEPPMHKSTQEIKVPMGTTFFHLPTTSSIYMEIIWRFCLFYQRKTYALYRQALVPSKIFKFTNPTYKKSKYVFPVFIALCGIF
jgi:hypothetical protein